MSTNPQDSAGSATPTTATAQQAPISMSNKKEPNGVEIGALAVSIITLVFGTIGAVVYYFNVTSIEADVKKSQAALNTIDEQLKKSQVGLNQIDSKIKTSDLSLKEYEVNLNRQANLLLQGAVQEGEAVTTEQYTYSGVTPIVQVLVASVKVKNISRMPVRLERLVIAAEEGQPPQPVQELLAASNRYASVLNRRSSMIMPATSSNEKDQKPTPQEVKRKEATEKALAAIKAQPSILPMPDSSVIWKKVSGLSQTYDLEAVLMPTQEGYVSTRFLINRLNQSLKLYRITYSLVPSPNSPVLQNYVLKCPSLSTSTVMAFGIPYRAVDRATYYQRYASVTTGSPTPTNALPFRPETSDMLYPPIQLDQSQPPR